MFFFFFSFLNVLYTSLWHGTLPTSIPILDPAYEHEFLLQQGMKMFQFSLHITSHITGNHIPANPRLQLNIKRKKEQQKYKSSWSKLLHTVLNLGVWELIVVGQRTYTLKHPQRKQNLAPSYVLGDQLIISMFGKRGM